MTLGMKKIVRSTFLVFSVVMSRPASSSASALAATTDTSVKRRVKNRDSQNLSSFKKIRFQLAAPVQTALSRSSPFQSVEE
ncbi:hypothetical protein D3C81_1572510 [compost metagenome]